MAGKARVRIYPEQVPDGNVDVAWHDTGAGDFGFCGIRAVAEIRIPYGNDWIVTTLKSPGLWGIADDSDPDYLAEVFEQEKAILLEMLASLRDFELVP